MTCSAKYLENSIFYQPWKTKYIESFCVLYAKLKIKSKQDLTPNEYKNFVHLFLNVYKLALNILQRKLLADNHIKLKFYSDVIHTAKEQTLISDEKTFFGALKFANEYHFDKKNIYKFDESYLEILKEFHSRFKQLSLHGGTREPNYAFYDNSYCLWGIDKRHYKRLVELFLTFESLKIVRIFGSRVTLNYSEFSDIDLICEGTYDKHEFIDIREKIREFQCPYIMDLYDINHPNKAFLYRNLIRSNILYERSNYIEDSFTSALITKKAT